MKITRREALKLGLSAGSSVFLPYLEGKSALAVELSPQIPRFQLPFRILNASASRAYNLVLSQKEESQTIGDRLIVIGTDAGLLSEKYVYGIRNRKQK